MVVPSQSELNPRPITRLNDQKANRHWHLGSVLLSASLHGVCPLGERSKPIYRAITTWEEMSAKRCRALASALASWICPSLSFSYLRLTAVFLQVSDLYLTFCKDYVVP